MLQIQDDRTAWRAVVIWIGIWTAVRLVWGAVIPLVPDETNYWQWGRHLAWGYHDQAPLIGWAIGLFTRIFGDHEFAVRLPSVLAVAVASIYLSAFARRWFGARAAWGTVLLTQGILLLNIGGILATADGIQAAAWAGAVYHTARAYDEDAWSQWLGAGFWLGFGLLSKYTMVLFGVCALGYGLSSAQHRHRLVSLKPYVGLALGCLMFAPVLRWNAAHGWNSARHVAGLAGAKQTMGLHLEYVGDFLAATVGLLTPLVFAGMVWGLGRMWRKRHVPRPWPVAFCLWTSLPVLGVFLGLSLHTRVYGNWPGAGYLTLAVLAAVIFAECPLFWRWMVGSAYVCTLALLVLIPLQLSARALPINPKRDRVARELLGWDQVGRQAGQMLAALPNPTNAFLFATRYQLASELAFYTPGQPETVSINRWGRPNVYDYWWGDAELLGRDAIGVLGASNAHLTTLPEVFERVEPPVALPMYRKLPETGEPQSPVKTYYFYRCYGFKGGLRPAQTPP